MSYHIEHHFKYHVVEKHFQSKNELSSFILSDIEKGDYTPLFYYMPLFDDIKTGLAIAQKNCLFNTHFKRLSYNCNIRDLENIILAYRLINTLLLESKAKLDYDVVIKRPLFWSGIELSIVGKSIIIKTDTEDGYSYKNTSDILYSLYSLFQKSIPSNFGYANRLLSCYSVGGECCIDMILDYLEIDELDKQIERLDKICNNKLKPGFMEFNRFPEITPDFPMELCPLIKQKSEQEIAADKRKEAFQKREAISKKYKNNELNRICQSFKFRQRYIFYDTLEK